MIAHWDGFFRDKYGHARCRPLASTYPLNQEFGRMGCELIDISEKAMKLVIYHFSHFYKNRSFSSKSNNRMENTQAPGGPDC